LILSIDTSTDACTVALVHERGPCHEITIPVRTGHAGSLLPLVDTLFSLSPHSKDDVELIVAGIGPGSFTGIRIGIATAKGLSHALGCRIEGVCTLDAMAFAALPAGLPVMPVVDARKSEVFCRLYAPDLTPLTEPMNLRPESLTPLITEKTLFIGNGIALYRDVLSRTLGESFMEGPEHLWHPRASVMGRMALPGVCPGILMPAEPLYVRSSNATMALKRHKG
jgi:tRNA threonylcarbamoyladenosine biosynthesis protein TsaB